MYINSPNKHANRLKPQTRKNTLSFSFQLTPPNFDSCAITFPVSDLGCHHWCRCLALPPDPTISKICYLLHTPNARCAYSPGRGLGRWPRLYSVSSDQNYNKLFRRCKASGKFKAKVRSGSNPQTVQRGLGPCNWMNSAVGTILGSSFLSTSKHHRFLDGAPYEVVYTNVSHKQVRWDSFLQLRMGQSLCKDCWRCCGCENVSSTPTECSHIDGSKTVYWDPVTSQKRLSASLDRIVFLPALQYTLAKISVSLLVLPCLDSTGRQKISPMGLELGRFRHLRVSPNLQKKCIDQQAFELQGSAKYQGVNIEN